jgi:hypothetical protein
MEGSAVALMRSLRLDRIGLTLCAREAPPAQAGRASPSTRSPPLTHSYADSRFDVYEYVLVSKKPSLVKL